MRIIAEPAHPDFKITIFKNGLKYSIQIEGPNSQLIYKLPEIPAFESNESVLMAFEDRIKHHAIQLIQHNEREIRNALQGYQGTEHFDEIF